MRRLIFCLLLPMTALVPASPAAAQSWVNIGKNTAGSIYDVDWDTIRRTGDRVNFTLRVQYGSGATAGEADGYVAIRQADCAARTYADLQTDYMKDGKLLRSSGLEETKTVKPDTIAADVFEKVCAK